MFIHGSKSTAGTGAAFFIDNKSSFIRNHRAVSDVELSVILLAELHQSSSYIR